MSTKTRNQIRRRKLHVQKFFGVVMVAICIVIVMMAFTAKVDADRDITAAVLLAPIGAYLLLTKRVVIY